MRPWAIAEDQVKVTASASHVEVAFSLSKWPLAPVIARAGAVTGGAGYGVSNPLRLIGSPAMPVRTPCPMAPVPPSPHPHPRQGQGDARQSHLRTRRCPGLPRRLRRPRRERVRPHRRTHRHRPVHEPGHPGHEPGTLRKRQARVLDRRQRLLHRGQKAADLTATTITTPRHSRSRACAATGRCGFTRA